MGRPRIQGPKPCARCRTEKENTPEFFPYRDKSRGYLSSWCRDCHAEHKSAPEVVVRSLELQRERRRSVVRVCKLCAQPTVPFGLSICPPCKSAKRKAQKVQEKATVRSRLRKAMPPWADRGLIRDIYELARIATRETGEPWHVDHDIPLRGRSVSGLHVPSNLRVVPAEVNLRKQNHYSLEHEGVK